MTWLPHTLFMLISLAQDLKTELARRGLNVMGMKDELVLRLRKALLKEFGSSNGGGGKGAGEDEVLSLAKHILALKDNEDPAAVLSMAGMQITEDSSKGAMRKAYFKVTVCRMALVEEHQIRTRKIMQFLSVLY